MPHFHYCLLAWGSTIKNRHKHDLLQKKAVRIINNNHYIAHTDSILKKLHMVKVTDMFRIAIWKYLLFINQETIYYRPLTLIT